jgi:acyl carrier protein
MTTSSLTLIQPTPAINEGFDINKVRMLIADHLDVDVECVTDEAHFTDDLGADWLDHLELMIVIEEQFVGVEIADDDVDQIVAVGDLIRYIVNMDKHLAGRRRHGAAGTAGVIEPASRIRTGR